MGYIYTMEYHSAIGKHKILPFAATWMDLEIVTLNEVSQTQKEYHIAHMWNKKGGTNETIYKTGDELGLATVFQALMYGN